MTTVIGTAHFGDAATEALKLPSGVPVGNMDQGALYKTLAALKIPGFSHSKGRADNLAAYRAHLEQIHAEAGAAAVSAWMRANHNA